MTEDSLAKSQPASPDSDDPFSVLGKVRVVVATYLRTVKVILICPSALDLANDGASNADIYSPWKFFGSTLALIGLVTSVLGYNYGEFELPPAASGLEPALKVVPNSDTLLQAVGFVAISFMPWLLICLLGRKRVSFQVTIRAICYINGAAILIVAVPLLCAMSILSFFSGALYFAVQNNMWVIALGGIYSVIWLTRVLADRLAVGTFVVVVALIVGYLPLNLLAQSERSWMPKQSFYIPSDTVGEVVV